jgi:hypothetical protein
MTYSLAAASVNPSAFPTTFNVSTSLAKNQTAAQAVNIGNLDEQSDTISVSDQGQTALNAVSTSFAVQSGDTSTLSENFGNFVNQITTQFQLVDSQGTVIADNQGSTAQQNAFTQWVAGTLTLPTGTYTATAIPESGVGGGVNISTSSQQGTALNVTSQLTGGDSSEYYNFSLSGTNLKLAFDAGSSTPSTRVQILNANGQIIADSRGNVYQKANYAAITSGTGLAATAGNYSVAVTYAPGANATKPISYNFQLYSGTNYAVVYKTKATAQAYDNTAAGSVSADTKAKLYTRSAYNSIGATAASAINIGWLQQNKSSLDVLSQLTNADSTDFYSFTLQQGNNLKFGFDSTQTPKPNNYHVTIYDGSGSYVVADNQGTAAQKAAYTSLTTTNGLTAKPGNYLISIGYAEGVTHSTGQYQFNLFSGTTYTAQYKTTASAQSYQNYALSGGTGTGAISSSAAIASYLSSSTGVGTIADLIASSTSTIA